MSEMTGISSDILDANENINSEKYLIFSIADKFYCFPSRMISGISLFETVYPLPLVPSWVLGVINRYSVPYALFDIGLLFYNTPSPHKKILIMNEEIDRIAFLINDVEGITDIQNEKLIKIERNQESDDITEAVSASFKWNEKDIFVLDINRILSRLTGEKT